LHTIRGTVSFDFNTWSERRMRGKLTTARRESRADPVLETARGSSSTTSRGAPLERGIGQRFEQSFGHTFADVRVHDDARADSLARDLGARALTVGDDIFFRAGAYESDTPAGLHLLAHEAAHTVQQRSAREGAAARRDTTPDDRAPGEGDDYDALEAAADTAADAVLLGGEAAIATTLSSATGALGVQCKEDVGVFNNSKVKSPWLQGGWDVATDDLLGGLLDFGNAAGRTGSEAMGTAGGVLSPLSIFQGGFDVADAIWGDNSTGEAVEKGVTGGLNIFSGGTSLGGLMGALPSVAGTTTMGGIAAGGGGAMLAAGGQVAAAGLAGYEAGKGLDALTGLVGGATSGDKRSLSTRIADRSWAANEWGDDFFGSDLAGDVLGGAALVGQSLTSPIIGAGEMAYDVGSWGAGKVGDAADYISDNVTLDPDEIDWGRTFSPWNW